MFEQFFNFLSIKYVITWLYSAQYIIVFNRPKWTINWDNFWLIFLYWLFYLLFYTTKKTRKMLSVMKSKKDELPNTVRSASGNSFNSIETFASYESGKIRVFWVQLKCKPVYTILTMASSPISLSPYILCFVFFVCGVWRQMVDG